MTETTANGPPWQDAVSINSVGVQRMQHAIAPHIREVMAEGRSGCRLRTLHRASGLHRPSRSSGRQLRATRPSGAATSYSRQATSLAPAAKTLLHRRCALHRRATTLVRVLQFGRFVGTFRHHRLHSARASRSSGSGRASHTRSVPHVRWPTRPQDCIGRWSIDNSATRTTRSCSPRHLCSRGPKAMTADAMADLKPLSKNFSHACAQHT